MRNDRPNPPRVLQMRSAPNLDSKAIPYGLPLPRTFRLPVAPPAPPKERPRPTRVVLTRDPRPEAPKPKRALHLSGVTEFPFVIDRVVTQTRRAIPHELEELLAAPRAAVDFLSESIDLTAPDTWILEDATVPPLQSEESAPRAVIASLRINDIRGINRFFMRVNHRLRAGGRFAIRVRTLEDDVRELRRTYGRGPGFYARWGTEFFWKRVVPKLKASRYLYFAVNGGRNRAFSETEALGRLVYCGFTIESVRHVEGLMYIVAQRTGEPAREVDPSYWPIFKMPRLGQGGKPIAVYKLRTMYPYADSLQEYVYERNKLAEGGKFRDDFRVTEWGRVFRRLWIDELPMILNWLRRDLKLVGVRPLSRQYLSLYPPALVEYRQRFKPGLVPPFYADLPRTIEEIVKSEERYLQAYERNPIATDCRYLGRALYNMVFRGIRSN